MSRRDDNEDDFEDFTDSWAPEVVVLSAIGTLAAAIYGAYLLWVAML